jgi:hypothetical protein
MATQLQIRRGTTAQMNAFTGAEGELAVNTTTDTVHVHDGATAGGFALAKADGSNIGTYAGSFTTISASGAITANGGIALGDNDKATFGASDDLQIYHDGTHSTIADEGTGQLKLTTNGTNIQLNKGTSENMLVCTVDGSVDLYYDNNPKLATTSTGIDVTGNMIADGVGIGTSSPSRLAHLYGTSNPALRLDNGTNTVDIGIATSNGALLNGSSANDLVIARNGAYNIKFGTNGSTRAVIDSSGNVGIGDTTFTAGKLQVYDSAGNHVWLKGRASDGTSSVSFRNNSDSTYNGRIQVADTGGMQFAVGGTERMRISGSNVGIGTSSPNQLLTVGNSSGGATVSISTDQAAGSIGSKKYMNLDFSGYANTVMARIQSWDESSSTGNGYLTFHTTPSGGSVTERMRIDSSGNVGIGVSSLNNPLEVAVTPNTTSKTSGSAFDGAAIRLNGNLSTTNSESAIIAGLDNGIQAGIGFMRESISNWGSAIKFYTRQAAVVDLDGVAERMRIDSSGNLLVGTTTPYNYSGIAPLLTIDNSAGIGIRNVGSSNAGYSTIPSANHNYYAGFFLNSSGSGVGNIFCTGSSTAYNTSSDYRLKENVVAMSGATERLKQLNPSRFNFIEVPDTTVDGFLAHEVQAVVPEAITGTKDAMRDEEYEVTPAVLDDDGNVTTEAVMGTRSVPDYQGIDQSKLVPLLVATIQELEARLTALENN